MTRICEFCSVDISHKRSDARFCSRKCNAKSWNTSNKELANIKAKERYYKNPEPKRTKHKEWSKNNKDTISKRILSKLHTNPLFKFKARVRGLISGSFSRRGKTKTIKTEELLGCSILEFRIYIESKFLEGMSFENHGKWHLDHIIPISSATTEEEITNLCHYSNFQPLWAFDNLSKGNKIV